MPTICSSLVALPPTPAPPPASPPPPPPAAAAVMAAASASSCSSELAEDPSTFTSTPPLSLPAAGSPTSALPGSKWGVEVMDRREGGWVNSGAWLTRKAVLQL